MTQPRVPLADRLRAVPDPKARGRLRVAEVVSAHRTSGLSWVGANGWTFVLDGPPDAHLSARDSQRAAARFDLTVRDGARVVFRDRILAWDGTPVMVPDGPDAFREDPVLGARMDIEHTVKVVTKGGTVPHVKAKPGTVSTFYSATTDGGITSSHATTYSTARAGFDLSAQTAVSGHAIGQRKTAGGDYVLYESFFQWDTSALGGDTISAAVFSLYGVSDTSATDFTVEARLNDWGAALTTADWVAGADLSAKTLLATFATSGFSTAGYNDFTDVAFPANINAAGSTLVVVCSANQTNNTAPTGDEYVNAYQADQAGTTNDPKLVVTHAAAPVTRDVTSAAAVSVAVTRDVTGAAAISATVTRNVTTAAATSAAVTRDVGSAGALSLTATRDVTSGASISTGVVVTRDVTSAASVSADAVSDVTTAAALSATVTSNVTSAAALSTTAASDVTSGAAVSMTLTADVTSAAAIETAVTRSVTSAAAIEATVASDVTSGAAVSATLTLDVWTAAALSVAVASDVTSGAAVGITVTRDVTSAASLFVPVARSVTTAAAIGFIVASDVTTGASLYLARTVRAQLGGGSVSTDRLPGGTVTGTGRAAGGSVEQRARLGGGVVEVRT